MEHFPRFNGFWEGYLLLLLIPDGFRENYFHLLLGFNGPWEGYLRFLVHWDRRQGYLRLIDWIHSGMQLLAAHKHGYHRHIRGVLAEHRQRLAWQLYGLLDVLS